MFNKDNRVTYIDIMLTLPCDSKLKLVSLSREEDWRRKIIQIKKRPLQSYTSFLGKPLLKKIIELKFQNQDAQRSYLNYYYMFYETK